MIPPAPHDGSTLVLRRAFTASRQRVFRAWIEPEALASWFRPKGKSVTVRSLEAPQGWETIVTLDFLDQGSGTEVVLTHERLSTPELLALFGSGWPSLLDALAEVLFSLHLDF